MRSNTKKRTARKNRAVVLFGPTAVGKTAMTEALFSGSAEIISADSVQVYRGFDIGSAKPDGHLLRLIPHHLIDIRDPWEQYTAGDFVRDAEALIPQIISRGRIPLITGGTAYYFRQLISGPSEAPKSDPEVRESVRREIEEKGSEWAYSYLGEIDPVSHGRIAAADIYRISRAIEVYRSSGRPLSSYAASSAPDADYIIICLVRDKAELSARIEMRVEEMFRLGLYDEVRELFRKGADASWPAMNAIGYREFLEAAETGEASLLSIKESIIRNTRQYAKRQMTFFRSFASCRFFHPDDIEGIRSALIESGISPDALGA